MQSTETKQNFRHILAEMLLSRRLPDAESFLLDKAKEGFFENVCWNRLMTEYKRGNSGPTQNGWIEVLRLFRKMQEIGKKPDVVSYNILIDTAGKAKQIECAMQFYNEMRAAHLTPTVSTFTSLIDALGKANELQRALHLLQSMLQDGVCPNECTFTSLLNACIQANPPELRLALNVLTLMLGCDAAAVCAVPYTCLIRACGKAMDIEAAFVALQSVLLAGVRPALSTFNFLIEFSGKARRLDLAWHAWTLLMAYGHQPDSISFAAMICSLSWLEDVDHSVELLWYMATTGMAITNGLCSLLLGAATRLHNKPAAFSVLDVMAHMNVRPLVEELANVFDMCNLTEVDAHAKLRFADHLLKYMVHSKVKPTRSTFVALIRACDGDVQRIAQLLLSSRMEITRDDWTRNMLQACFDTHALAFAVSIIEDLRLKGLKPDLTAARGLLSMCLAVGDLDSHTLLQNLLCACGIPLADVLSSGSIPYPLVHWTLVPMRMARKLSVKPPATPSKASTKREKSKAQSPQSATDTDVSSPDSSEPSVESYCRSSWC